MEEMGYSRMRLTRTEGLLNLSQTENISSLLQAWLWQIFSNVEHAPKLIDWTLKLQKFLCYLLSVVLSAKKKKKYYCHSKMIHF